MPAYKKNSFFQFFVLAFFLFIGFLFLPTTLHAQVLKPGKKFEEKKGGEKPTQQAPNAQTPSDTTQTATQDSTQQKAEIPDSIAYGPNTVWYLLMSDLKARRQQGRLPDTLVGRFQAYNFLQRYGYLRQDLGNMGTANQSIFATAPERLGYRWGFSNYDIYTLPPDSLRFFNTYSPYTELYLIQGGQGKSHLKVTFARNINPEWSFSVFYHRMSSNFITGRSFQRNDPQLTHQHVGGTMRYFTPSRRYKALFSYVHHFYDVAETGGLRTENDTLTANDLLEANDAALDPRLENAKSFQYGRRYNFYQEWALKKGSGLVLFHEMDFNHRGHAYRDEAFVAANEVYPRTFFDSTAKSRSIYKTVFVTNEQAAGVGIPLGKNGGRLNASAHWRTYKHETRLTRDSTDRDTTRILDLTSLLSVEADLMVQIKENPLRLRGQYVPETGEALLGAQFSYDAFAFRGRFVRYSPSLQAQRMFGGHYQWDNDFNNTQHAEIEATYSYAIKDWLTVQPRLNFTNIRNYIYFDENQQAAQYAPAISQFHAGLRLAGKRGPWSYFLEAGFHQNLDTALVQMPQLTAQGTLRHTRAVFSNAMQAVFGLDAYWKSAYFADAWSAPLQQFYWQDADRVGSFPVVDLYFNFKVRRVSVFLKLNNALLDVAGDGYHDTPFYFSQPRSFEVGVRWMFFD